ncbi:xanthine dehydrogenase family protein molybdopterin-binding subunit [Undibacterium flavidum]|uniref:Xanthine dehydrogenase family protein molybdopterin-binding subunit n=1 Tax=Undibacterium flavidum TaxID=2762297 RepID=A0ABR6YAG7_9BURK|nr:molybdopterin cofactor-binding domain-containing protein [Undibacterium flavidum]MBC3873578.1 xanthine dehydrogenase family protein molybdopterin-binding subunit [Undibacterium flavidum]
MKRRDFLRHLGNTGLLIAIPFAHTKSAAATLKPIAKLTADTQTGDATLGWVRIATDNSVTIFSNTSEIGQGTGTSLAQILADELDLDWRNVQLQMAPLEMRFFNAKLEEYGTYGSSGVAKQFIALRQAGALARAKLLAVASTVWSTPISHCTTKNGTVIHLQTGATLSYGELALAASTIAVSEPVPQKSKSDWRCIGKPMPRLDLPAKVNGTAIYGIDVQVPDMLVATLRHSPKFGANLRKVDTKPALKIDGVKQVIELANAVAVLADSYWSAKRGVDSLQPVWNDKAASKHSSASYRALLQKTLTQAGPLFVAKGKTQQEVETHRARVQTGASKFVDAVYHFPFLAHATMEPMTATAHVTETHAELWLPTQTQSATRDYLANALGLAIEQITIHTTFAGGGFGRREEFDFALQAATLSRISGKPVKLIWSREEDIQHDYYRPASAIKIRAALNQHGMPLSLQTHIACESLLTYSRMGLYKQEAIPIDTTAIGRQPDYYQIDSITTHVSTVDIGVPVGFWRSVSASQNVFAYERFIDSLARQTQLDGLQYRLRLVKENSREKKVLEAIATATDWHRPVTSGQHRGIAMSVANGSVIAHVVELSLNEKKQIRLHQITCVIDCGIAVNPNSVAAQVEGGIVFALSACFYGEISLQDGAVQQSNFHDYRLLTLAETPAIKVIILENSEQPGGVGEEAVGPLAPAVVNAIMAANSDNICSLPLNKLGYDLLPSRLV